MDGLQTERQGTIPASRRRSLWRNRDFLLLWSGQTVSVIGTQASQLAFALLVLFLTHSPEQAGFAGALRALPYFALSLPAGALMDRWNRKRVMVLCDIGRALALGSIPLAAAFDALTVEQLYLVAFVEGILFVLFDIAEVSCLPRVVSKDQLASATARNQAAEGASYLLGPALGGALYAVARLLPFVADALSYTISVVSLLLIRTPFQGERVGARRQLAREVGEGIVWLWRQPVIFFMALLSSGINFLAAGTSLVVILLAQAQGASSVVIGVILGIAGIGSIAGSLIAPHIQRHVRFGQAIAVTVWTNAILWPLYALAPNLLTLGAVTALIFVNGPIYNVVNIAYRLALVPDALQGRVNSVVRLISLGAIPPGLAVAGVLLQRLGAVPTVVVLAPGYLFLALAATINPALRHAQLGAQ